MSDLFKDIPFQSKKKSGDLSSLTMVVQSHTTQLVEKTTDLEQRAINVRQPPFNCKADGITDDSVSIQNAINKARDNGGGVVYFPKGVYLCHNIKVYSNIELTGSVSSVLKLKNNSTSSILVTENAVAASGSTTTDISISNLSFDGNKVNQSPTYEFSHAIRLGMCSRVRVEGVTISDMQGDGIYMGTTSNNVIVKGCSVRGVYRNAISVVNGSDITITSNILGTNAGSMAGTVDIEPNNSANTCRNIVISDNIITGLSAGVQVYNHFGADVGNIAISNNTINVSGNGIYVAGGKGVSISNNKTKASNQHGIFVSGASSRTTEDIQIANNQVKDSVYNGIHIEICQNVTVTGNIVRGGGYNVDSAGIQAITASRMVISGNDCSNINGNGIRINNNNANGAYVTIIGNMCMSNAPGWGITLVGSSDQNTLVGNVCFGNSGGNINSGTGVKNQIANNVTT